MKKVCLIISLVVLALPVMAQTTLNDVIIEGGRSLLGKVASDQAKRQSDKADEKYNSHQQFVGYGGKTVLTTIVNADLPFESYGVYNDAESLAAANGRRIVKLLGGTPIKSSQELENERERRDSIGDNPYVKKRPKKHVITGEPELESRIYIVLLESGQELDLGFGDWVNSVNLHLNTSLVNVVIYEEVWDWETGEMIGSYVAHGSASTTENFGLTLKNLFIGSSVDPCQKANWSAFTKAWTNLMAVHNRRSTGSSGQYRG